MFNTNEILDAIRLGKEVISTTFPINMKVVEYKINNESFKAIISDNGEHYLTVTQFGQFLNDELVNIGHEKDMIAIYEQLGTPLEETPQGELHYGKGDYNYTISGARDVLAHDIDGVLCCIHHQTGLYRVIDRDGNSTDTKLGEDFNVADIYIDIIKRLKDLEGQA